MKVVIDAHDRRVEIDDAEPGWDSKAATKALDLWRATAPTDKAESAPAYGFSHERRDAQTRALNSHVREVRA